MPESSAFSPGRFVELADLVWTEVAELDRAATLAILPLGAVEAHGPHLPLTTDGTIARAMAREGAGRLAERGVTSLLLPTLDYAAAPFARGFPGTISIRAATAAAMIVDIAESLADHGFPALALANAHLDPDHLEGIGRALDEIAQRALLRTVFPNLTRRPWATRLGGEFRSGACHAGSFESSIVMAEAGGQVRERARRSLEPVPISLSEAIREGIGTFEEAGGREAYFGDPAAASAEEGRQRVRALGEILAEAVLEALPELDRFPASP